MIVTTETIPFEQPANAHSWYPPECCHDVDCAPVDSVAKLTPADGGTPRLLVTSKHGTAIVPYEFPSRESKDGRMHICMSYDEFGNRAVLCFFAPPGM